jgi:predicted Zn finger-like uncharacterized protein
MIIACPACSTRYVVPDSAIGLEGRTVRCAKCRHSWYQAGPELPDPPVVESPAAEAPAAPVMPPEARGVPVPAMDAPIAEPAAPPRVAEPSQPEPADEGPSPFDHAPPFRPRRNPLKLWTIAAAAFATSVAALIGAVAWFGMPAWLPVQHQTFSTNHPDLELTLPPERQDRRTLPNGTEYFGVSGTVTNVGKDVREVPPILIVLHDAANRVVYTWNVIPPKDVLKPGESETINEAVTDVPKSAKFAEIGWKPE